MPSQDLGHESGASQQAGPQTQETRPASHVGHRPTVGKGRRNTRKLAPGDQRDHSRTFVMPSVPPQGPCIFQVACASANPSTHLSWTFPLYYLGAVFRESGFFEFVSCCFWSQLGPCHATSGWDRVPFSCFLWM